MCGSIESNHMHATLAMFNLLIKILILGSAFSGSVVGLQEEIIF